MRQIRDRSGKLIIGRLRGRPLGEWIGWMNVGGWRRRTLGEWIELVVFGVGGALVIIHRPFAHVRGFEAFEARHGGGKLDLAIYLAVLVAAKLLYGRFFGRAAHAAERVALQSDVRHGRLKRMSFAGRWLFIVCMLGVVSVGWYARQPDHARLLWLGGPLFLLFAAVEPNFIVHPGDTLMPDARDELLMFFKARMLQAGYVTGIAVLAVLYLIYLLAPAYIGLLIPVGLAVCLLVPGLVYRHLDRRAATDG